MTIKASDVKQLRDETGAGMMDCKKALTECNGDFKLAKNYLREKGLAKAAKKQSRIAAEGLCGFVENKNVAYLYELNTETDFASKNDEFLKLHNQIGKELINSKATSTSEALQIKTKQGSVEDLIVALIAKIGEKITLRNVLRIEKKSTEYFHHYKHQDGRIFGVVVLEKKNEDLGRDLCMQIVAFNPKYLTKDDIPEEILLEERKILTKQVINEGKPENIASKIVDGKIKKFYEENCLVDQIFFKETSLKISDLLSKDKNNVLFYKRIEVGEGIEKRQENFAEEVAAQIKK